MAAILVVPVIGLMAWQHFTQENIGVTPKWKSNRAPFPGLEAFIEDDAGVFFGRDAEISRLFDLLNPIATRNIDNVIPVVGPSGVGKSSLVQAGLISRLRKSRRRWNIFPPITPAANPFKELVAALQEMGVELPSCTIMNNDLIESLANVTITANLRTSSLLVIDQAEELITLTGENDREQFLELLVKLLATNPNLWVIIILRSEFLTWFLQSRFAAWFRNPLIVGALGTSALMELVQRPALEAGLRYDPPTLPQTIVSECHNGMALPMLAYMLRELYTLGAKSRVLTETAYRSLGGVNGAITEQADKMVSELKEQDANSPIMETLVKFVAVNPEGFTRRRVMRSTLTPAENRVVDGFIAARLLVGDIQIGSNNGDAIAEVTHEALFEHWAPLRHELEARAEILRLRADLERWADDWMKSDRNQAYLLQGERLDLAVKWASTVRDIPAEYPLLADFINQSQAADHATMCRLSESIAGKAVNALEVDPEHSIRLALAAYEDCSPTRPAYEALAAAVAASHVRQIVRCGDKRLRGVAWSPKEPSIAIASDDGAVYIWDLTAGSVHSRGL
jgi:Novel STAND NTPase 1